MKILVVGAGVVGLTTAALSRLGGHDTTVIDSDADKIDKLRSGVLPVDEPDILDKLTSISYQVPANLYEYADYDLIFVCVGTYGITGCYTGDAVTSVTYDLFKFFQGTPIVIRSSISPSSYTWLMNHGGDEHGSILINPEFLRAGHGLEDSRSPIRIVVGANRKDSNSRHALVKLQHFYDTSCNYLDYIETTPITAILIKYMSNAFLAMKVSYANLVDDLCLKFGGDTKIALKAIGLDERIGNQYLRPGLGFGGSCLPKDLEVIRAEAESKGLSANLFSSVQYENDRRVKLVWEQLYSVLGDDLLFKTIGVLGLTFKPDSADVRGAQACELLRLLGQKSVTVVAYDPHGQEVYDKLSSKFGGVTFLPTIESLVTHSDAVVIATDDSSFTSFKTNKPVIDLWGIRS